MASVVTATESANPPAPNPAPSVVKENCVAEQKSYKAIAQGIPPLTVGGGGIQCLLGFRRRFVLGRGRAERRDDCSEATVAK
ncbi:hypothetical protein RB195_010846 [Necator americanus]|uniref:Uncharacterized protein n=1 Tax=Necator americanus TaxID=51031 RepID=A0ABR1CZQ8_NECAM